MPINRKCVMGERSNKSLQNYENISIKGKLKMRKWDTKISGQNTI